MAAGKQLSRHVDRAILADHRRDGSTVPVRNILETAELHDLTEEHGFEGGLGGPSRHLNTGNLNFAAVLQHDATPVQNPSDFAVAQQLKTAGLTPVDIFSARAIASSDEQAS